MTLAIIVILLLWWLVGFVSYLLVRLSEILLDNAWSVTDERAAIFLVLVLPPLLAIAAALNAFDAFRYHRQKQADQNG